MKPNADRCSISTVWQHTPILNSSCNSDVSSIHHTSIKAAKAQHFTCAIESSIHIIPLLLSAVHHNSKGATAQVSWAYLTKLLHACHHSGFHQFYYHSCCCPSARDKNFERKEFLFLKKRWEKDWRKALLDQFNAAGLRFFDPSP